MTSKINLNNLKHINSKFKLLYSSQFSNITKYKNKHTTQNSKLIKKNKPAASKYIKKKRYQRFAVSKQTKKKWYQRPVTSKYTKKWYQHSTASKYVKKNWYQRTAISKRVKKRKNKRFKRIKKKYQRSFIFKRIKRIKKKTLPKLSNTFKLIKKVYRRRLKLRSIVLRNKRISKHFIKNVRQHLIKIRSNIIFNNKYLLKKPIIKTIIATKSNTIYNQFFNQLLQNHTLPTTPTKRKQAYLNSLIITPLKYTHYFNYINRLNASIKKSQQLRKVINKKYKWVLNKHINKNKLLRKRSRRWLTKFRKIKKNNAFIIAIRRNFPLLTGLSEKSLLFNWSTYRRGSNKYWGTQQLVTLFNHMLLMTPPNLLLFLNIIPSIAVGSQLTKSGGIIINGIHSSVIKFVKPGDVFQIIPNALIIANSLYSYHKVSSNNLFLQLPFLQIDYSMLLFLVLRWPYPFELIAPSFLSERWVRYYIRQIPVKLKKYRSIRLKFIK